MNTSKQPDAVTEALKREYFSMALREDYPKTPTLTKDLDEIEAQIKTRLNPVAISNAS